MDAAGRNRAAGIVATQATGYVALQSFGRNDEREADKLGVEAKNTAYIGDDIIDLPAIRLAGIGVTVRDGHPAVIREADWVTEKGGGQGAVREIADEILDAKMGLEKAIAALLGDA